MVYHSAIKVEQNTKTTCGAAVLPLKTQTPGPAQHIFEGQDIVDEAIHLFRSNVLFRKYDVQGPADRTLLYLTLYINACLKSKSESQGKGTLSTHTHTHTHAGEVSQPFSFFQASKQHEMNKKCPMERSRTNEHPAPSTTNTPLPSFFLSFFLSLLMNMNASLPHSLLTGTAGLKTKTLARKELSVLGGESFKIPGEVGFALGGFMFAPTTKEEGDLFRGYIKQCREEVNNRLLDFAFRQENEPDKYWYAFAKKTFMNKNLS
jgi:hypothetical protein